MAAASLHSRLGDLLDIRAGEGRLVTQVFFFGLFVSMVTTLARTTTFSIFIASFGSQQLPLVYIGLGLVSVACSYFYLHASSRLPLATVLVATFCFLILAFSALRLGLGSSDARWLLFALPISWGVLNVLVLTMFWNLAGRLFHLQQGKRLFGLFAASAEIGAIAIGLLTPTLVALLGSIDLLSVTVGLLIAALAILGMIVRSSRAPLSIRPTPATRQSNVGFRALASDRYIGLLFMVFTLFVVGIYFVDNIFYAQLEIVIGTADEMAIFVGKFFAVVGAISLFTQTFLTGRMINRFGVKSMIIVTPAVLGIGTALIALIGTFTEAFLVVFWLAVLTNLARCVLDAVDNAAVNVLYQPLPALERTRAQTIVDGILYPLGIGLSGVLLIVLREVLALDSVQVSYVQLLILAGWLVCAVLLGRAYPDRLARALRDRTLGTNAVADKTSLGLVRQGLKSPHFGAVIYSLELLEALSPAELPEHLSALMDHHDARVRIDAVRRVERLQLVDLLPAISRRLPFEASLSVRSASVRVLAALGDTIALEEMQIYLDRDEPEMTRGTLVGLLRSGEVEAIVAAAEKLGVLVGSADAKERELAARVLEEAGVAGLYRPVAKLMGDENADVRNAAITAAGALGHHRLWPDILSHLGDSLAHASASRSLRQAGAAAVPLLVRSLATEEREEVQVRLANLCGALADARLIAPLQSMLVRSTEPALRTAILEALAACGHRILDQEAHDWVLREVAEATWVLAGFCEIAEQSDLRPVRLALEAEIERRKSHIFTVLSMRHDAGLVHKLRDGLRDASMEQRAYALELLDVMVSSTLKPLLVALLDDFSHQQRFRRLNRRFPQTQLSPTDRLRAIIEAPPTYVRPWTRSCAIYAAGQSEEKSFTETLARAGQMRDPMVRETASWAVRRIGAASGRELETPKIGEPLTR